MTTDRQDIERQEEIRARAYALWEQEGKPEGRHLQHWLQAKRLIAAEELGVAGGAVLTHSGTTPHSLEERDE